MCTTTVPKKETLTVIITFEPSYFNRDQQIVMRDEGAGRDIHDDPTAPYCVTLAVNSSL